MIKFALTLLVILFIVYIFGNNSHPFDNINDE